MNWKPQIRYSLADLQQEFRIPPRRGLMPSDHHTVYSLRRSFQDSIENAGCSDRMQADLMGHEFGRPRYGDGAEMKRRQQFLEGIVFAWPQLAAS